MSGWLLDTNVISAFAPGKRADSAPLAAWLETNTNALFVSTVTVAEVTAGIAKLRRTGAVVRATRLTEWFEPLMSHYGERILPLDLAAARIAGELSDRALGRGHAPGFADAANAAIALSRSLTVLTTNLRHFEAFGVSAVDPFAGVPS